MRTALRILGSALLTAAFLSITCAKGFAGTAPPPSVGSAGTTTDASPARTPDGLIAPGQPAPGFALLDGSGKLVHLADLRGRPMILYFYPMDDTPGCTKEACAFRDHLASFDSLGVRIVGISADDPASHRAFAAKYHLTFPLLSDTAGAVMQAYGAGFEIDREGSKRWIAKRVTYLIDGEGTIRHVWPKVDPYAHSAEILHSWNELIVGSK